MVELPSYKRGCHVITRKVLEQLPELGEFDVGLVNFFSARRSYIQQLLEYGCQAHFELSKKAGGSHTVTLRRAVLHTSASLTINENASPDVPLDLNARPAPSFAQ